MGLPLDPRRRAVPHGRAGRRQEPNSYEQRGAGAAKLEGGRQAVDLTSRLVAHLGLTPQSVNELGGFRVQGRDAVKLTTGRLPRFVKAYADLRGVVRDAAKAFASEVATGDYPGPEHTY